jgi:hypothetical protein
MTDAQVPDAPVLRIRYKFVRSPTKTFGVFPKFGTLRISTQEVFVCPVEVDVKDWVVFYEVRGEKHVQKKAFSFSPTSGCGYYDVRRLQIVLAMPGGRWLALKPDFGQYHDTGKGGLGEAFVEWVDSLKKIYGDRLQPGALGRMTWVQKASFAFAGVTLLLVIIAIVWDLMM